MKQFLISLGFVCLSIISTAQSNMDVLHYSYQIELNDNNDTIKGTALIEFINNNKSASVSFDLASLDKNRKAMLVTAASFINRSSSSPGFSHSNNILTINAPGFIGKGDTASVLIEYKGIPSDGLIISKNKYGHRTFFSDNWPNRAHNWIPCNDVPGDKASTEFIVTAPSHYQVVSNGILVEETSLADNKKLTHWKEDVPLPTKVMVIGAADFAVNYAGDMDCIPVSSWVFPENKDKGFYDYAEAKDILSFFNNYIGPYPYKKLANVQSKTIFGGMENAGAIFYFENSVTGTRQEEALLAHEIVHQWFGDMATERNFAHLWLSEGFATYLTHVFIESKYGTDSLKKRMQHEREEIIDFAKTSDRPVVDSVSPYMQLLNVNSYQKGGWILHMLRRQLGDSVFHSIIRTYYNRYKGKNADTEDFKAIAEEVSRKNLDAFFKQWLYTPGMPQLKITWKYLPKEKKLSLTVEQLQQTGPFIFPIELSVELSATKSITQKLAISKKTETFNLDATDKPLRILTDPLVSLLFEGSITELK